MDLIREESVKSKYDKCKYKVKLWEHNFKKENGRLPSRLDIREADKDIRNAYRTYYHLKSKALEESFIDVAGFNSEDEPSQTTDEKTDIKESDTSILQDKDLNASNATEETKEVPVNTEKTWGKHLNNTIKEDSPKKSEDKKLFHTKITQKLFNGSKFSKRNPRKSLSFSHRKSDTNKPEFFSQPSTSTLENEESLECRNTTEINKLELDASLFNNDNVKVISAVQKVISQPLLVTENPQKQIRNIDTGWIQRITESTGIINENLSDIITNKSDCESDIIYSSDDDSYSTKFHATKRQRLISSQCTFSSQNVSFQDRLIINTSVANTSERKLDFSNIFNKKPESGDSCEAIVQENEKNVVNSSETQSSEYRLTRARKIRVLKESSESEAEAQDCKEHSNDKSFEFGVDEKQTDAEVVKQKVTSKNGGKKSKEKPAKKAGKKREPQVTEKSETEEYELEYSVKPRITSVPRVNTVKKLLKYVPIKSNNSSVAENEGNAEFKDKNQQLAEKFEKKISSGTLNENFRTINLKKKVFVRGRKSKTFSSYKKQQWKNKKKALSGPDMDMGGCDGGELICFNCGQTGHFARQCKATNGDSLLPLNVEEDCPIPTLEEASQMARESVLLVRKQKMTANDDDETKNDNSNPKNEDCDVFDDSDNDDLLAETLKMETAFKLDMKDYLDITDVVKPVYEPNADGNIIDTPDEVFNTLRKFGHTSFRPGQERAIMRILSGKSTLVTLSTGSGKSLCYQLPAYLYSLRRSCITLVISPLVSLMEDQVTGIPSFLKAACLHTYQTKTQREKIMERISTGNLNVLLVSPEAIVAGEKSTGFGSLIRKLPPIAFACIDEVHCVSQWSHNFRPSYLMICRVLHDRLGVKTILGLTATATRATCDSIIQHIKIPDGREGVIQDIPLPDNLHLTVSRDAERDQALLALLLSERFKECKSIIVYCTRRDECERVASFLRTCLKYQSAMNSNKKKRKRLDVQVEPYHAGMSASRRKAVQTAFMSDELRIVVATVAFGMGINKSDIRSVIHYNLPGNFESYVQEIGRAGRDGLPAYCHLFLDVQGKDLKELRRHIYANSIERHVIRKLLQKVFLPCSCKNTCPKHEVAFSIEETVRALDIPEENISTLLCYLELHKNRYIEVLSPAYVTCKVISYGGPLPIRKAAKECPPLAVALILHENSKNKNVLEFPVIDIAAAIGWDSGICKHKLKNLEWTAENNQPKRSLLSVQFSNLGFRLLAPGNLSAAELDEALDSLYEHVTAQERTALLQLQALHNAVTAVSEKTYKTCLSEDKSECNQMLKLKIREYFESAAPLENIPELESTDSSINEDLIISDVRALICMYKDNAFTGRAIARIFHGIQSPNYPAVIWGRCKFWRLHINSDFHALCQIATAEILKMR